MGIYLFYCSLFLLSTLATAAFADGGAAPAQCDCRVRHDRCAEHKLLLNPAFGDDIYHTHPAGGWMVNYRYSRTSQRGLGHGTRSVAVESVTPEGSEPYGYMMAPTDMTMEMHMVMLMYGVTDTFSLMAMGGYMNNEMGMVMNMGMGNRTMKPMRSAGVADTEIRAVMAWTDRITASLGLSIPTGDIDQTFVTMKRTYRAPYDMQLGSGTFDLKPALTYSASSDSGDWNWGGQLGYTYHLDRNDNGYSLGDSVKATGWLQRAFGPAAGWLRLAYSNTGRIKGRDAEIDRLLVPMTGASTPDADPRNYGGDRLDGFIGVSTGLGPVRVGVEAGIPLYQNLNGLQLKTEWSMTAGVQGVF